MGLGTTFTEYQHRQIFALHKAGWKHEEIAKVVKCHHTTVGYSLNKRKDPNSDETRGRPTKVTLKKSD